MDFTKTLISVDDIAVLNNKTCWWYKDIDAKLCFYVGSSDFFPRVVALKFNDDIDSLVIPITPDDEYDLKHCSISIRELITKAKVVFYVEGEYDEVANAKSISTYEALKIFDDRPFIDHVRMW